MIKKYIPKSAHNIFLLIAIPVILFFVIFNPPTHGLDEGSHLIRSYQLSRGHLYPEPNNKDTLPYELEQFIQKNFPGTEDRIPFGFGGTAVITDDSVQVKKSWTDVNTMGYPPIVYIPSAIGFKLAGALHFPVGLSVWTAKIFSSAIYVLLIYAALRFLKDKKFRWIIFAISLLPMSLYGAATISGDFYTNGVTLLFLSIIFGLVLDKRVLKPNRQTLILFTSSTLLLFFVKTPYLLVLLPLIFLVPNTALLNSEKKAVALKIILLIFGLIIAGAIYKIGSTGIYNPFENMPQYVNASPEKQLSHMINTPQYTAKTLLTDSVNSFGGRVSSMVGSFGDTARLKDHTDTSFFVTFLGAMAIIVASTNSEKIHSKRKRIIIFFAISVLYLGIILSMWIHNSVGAMVIQGVQGRYFIPLIVLLALLLPKIKYLTGKLENLVILLVFLTLGFYLIEYIDKIITVFIKIA